MFVVRGVPGSIRDFHDLVVTVFIEVGLKGKGEGGLRELLIGSRDEEVMKEITREGTMKEPGEKGLDKEKK